MSYVVNHARRRRPVGGLGGIFDALKPFSDKLGLTSPTPAPTAPAPSSYTSPIGVRASILDPTTIIPDSGASPTPGWPSGANIGLRLGTQGRPKAPVPFLTRYGTPLAIVGVGVVAVVLLKRKR